MKHRTVDVWDGSWSHSSRRDHSGFNGCCTAMWKANGKIYHIITFPGQSLSRNRETQFGRDYGPVARQTNTWTIIHYCYECLGAEKDSFYHIHFLNSARPHELIQQFAISEGTRELTSNTDPTAEKKKASTTRNGTLAVLESIEQRRRVS
jgi:hypothetical protein